MRPHRLPRPATSSPTAGPAKSALPGPGHREGGGDESSADRNGHPGRARGRAVVDRHRHAFRRLPRAVRARCAVVGRRSDLVSGQTSRDDAVAATAENTPHGFTCCWRADVGSLMRLAGDTASRASLVPGDCGPAQEMTTRSPARQSQGSPLSARRNTDALADAVVALSHVTVEHPSLLEARLTACTVV